MGKTPLDELRVKLRRLIIAQRNDATAFGGDNENNEIETREIGQFVLAPHSAAVFAYLNDTIMAVPPEIAGAALEAAIEIFDRAGHAVHPGKSACWSLGTACDVLPAGCQRIWHEYGLLVGGIPVYDESAEPALAKNKLRGVVNAATKKLIFWLSSCAMSNLQLPKVGQERKRVC